MEIKVGDTFLEEILSDDLSEDFTQYYTILMKAPKVCSYGEQEYFVEMSYGDGEFFHTVVTEEQIKTYVKIERD